MTDAPEPTTTLLDGVLNSGLVFAGIVLPLTFSYSFARKNPDAAFSGWFTSITAHGSTGTALLLFLAIVAVSVGLGAAITKLQGKRRAKRGVTAQSLAESDPPIYFTDPGALLPISALIGGGMISAAIIAGSISAPLILLALPLTGGIAIWGALKTKGVSHAKAQAAAKG